jgi:hypothetical protein
VPVGLKPEIEQEETKETKTENHLGYFIGII